MKFFHILVFIPVVSISSLFAQGGFQFLNNGNEYIRYGKWEIRARCTPCPGVTHDFCLINSLGWNSNGTADASDDIVDSFYQVTVNVHGNKPFLLEAICEGTNTGWWDYTYWNMQTTQHSSEYNLDMSYHTYSVEWTPDRVALMLDGIAFRVAESIDDELIRVIEYDCNGREFSNNIIEHNWVKALQSGSMTYYADIYKSVLETTGIWSDDNCGKAMFFSWFRYYQYTPGSGTDGSDFTLRYFNTFDGAGLDDEWIHAFDMEERDGKGIAVLFCDSNKTYAGEVPVDENDTVLLPTYSAYPVQISSKSKYDLSVCNYTISYTLPEESFVSLCLYDAVGRCENIIVEAVKPSGMYSVKINIEEIRSGTYLLVLKSNQNQVVRKIIKHCNR